MPPFFLKRPSQFGIKNYTRRWLLIQVFVDENRTIGYPGDILQFFIRTLCTDLLLPEVGRRPGCLGKTNQTSRPTPSLEMRCSAPPARRWKFLLRRKRLGI